MAPSKPVGRPFHFDIEVPRMSPSSHSRRLWRFVRDHRGEVIVTAMFMTTFSASSLILPWLVQLMLSLPSVPDRYPNPVLVISAFGFSTLSGFFAHEWLHRLGLSLRNELRNELFGSLMTKPFHFYVEHQVGELSSRASDSLGRVNMFFPGYVGPMYQNTVLTIGALAFMMAISWQATLAVVLLIAVPLPFLGALSRHSQRSMYDAQSRHADAHAILEESLVAIQDVRAFGLEARQEGAYRHREENAVQTEISAIRFQGFLNQGVFFVTSFLLVGIFWGGTGGKWFPGWRTGELVAFYMYAYTLAMAVVSGGRIFTGIQGMLGAVRHVVELSDRRRPEKTGSHSGTLRGKIELDNVTFGYSPGKEIFRQFGLQVEPGDWIVITGPSGSGKSTLSSLMMGFYAPQAGVVRYDEVPLSDWDLAALRRQMGYVSQRPFLFHGTIRENVTLGRDISLNRLEEVLRIGNLEAMISDLPAGLEAIVEERGINVSGGQRLRLALARALATNPAILILDEPNAMLESELEQALWKELKRDRSNHTTIIFTHHIENIPGPYVSLELPSALRPFRER